MSEMKYREKDILAADYENLTSTYFPDHSRASAFLAGFERAKELASDLVANSWDNPKYNGKQIKGVVVMMAEDIVRIGDQEVSNAIGKKDKSDE